MNRRKFERYLKQHNCVLYEHGSGHDKWRRIDAERGTVIPRHAEIKPGTITGICKDLGIPFPPER